MRQVRNDPVLLRGYSRAFLLLLASAVLWIYHYLAFHWRHKEGAPAAWYVSMACGTVLLVLVIFSICVERFAGILVRLQLYASFIIVTSVIARLIAAIYFL